MSQNAWEERVKQLEADGLTRSDAQSVADVDEQKGRLPMSHTKEIACDEHKYSQWVYGCFKCNPEPGGQLISHPPCKCEILQVADYDNDSRTVRIKYCPLHLAAPAMLERLKLQRDYLREASGIPDKQLDGLIATAEGR